MSFTYDIETTLGMLRLRLTDTNQDSAVFSDDELQAILDECGGDLDCATLRALRILKAAAALRGDASRASAIDNVIQLLPDTAIETSMPTITGTTYPAPFPMDDAYEEVES
ncbi:MAG TPA: hypothetical protein ENL12_02100 [Dehalococcoidia bacterium]|nr:hypothetical protein [Dehalococcoidia bacterium]